MVLVVRQAVDVPVVVVSAIPFELVVATVAVAVVFWRGVLNDLALIIKKCLVEAAWKEPVNVILVPIQVITKSKRVLNLAILLCRAVVSEQVRHLYHHVNNSSNHVQIL